MILSGSTISLPSTEHWLRRLLALSAVLTASVLVLIIGFLLLEALPVLTQVGLQRFFLDDSWHPVEGSFNLLPMLLGSLYLVLGSVVMTVPLGIAVALCINFYTPVALRSLLRQLLHLMAGIPSVVYGLWGLVVLVPIINTVQAPGASLLAGILILTMMTLPQMALTLDASLNEQSKHQWYAAAALGLSRWAYIKRLALPGARHGLMAGSMLQTARALGETMAVLMVCGNVVRTPDSLFAPVRALTANIALEMAYALEQHRSALFVSGLLLMLLVGALVLLAERRSVQHND